MNFDRLVEISRALKGEKQTGRQFHVTFVLFKNRIREISWNNYQKTHPRTINYISRFGNTHTYVASQHSEQIAYGKIIKQGFDCRDFTFVNIRINNNNELSLAMACPNCYAFFLKKYGFKRFYYSNQFGGFSRIEDGDDEKYRIILKD